MRIDIVALSLLASAGAANAAGSAFHLYSYTDSKCTTPSASQDVINLPDSSTKCHNLPKTGSFIFNTTGPARKTCVLALFGTKGCPGDEFDLYYGDTDDNACQKSPTPQFRSAKIVCGEPPGKT